ncbi:DUF6283 family protein [Streptomyces olindensis]|uniref:DUF6283 family protein n=1 Tax=Streptomyces olindensis TaxID=358823 RepID=UPI0036633583
MHRKRLPCQKEPLPSQTTSVPERIWPRRLQLAQLGADSSILTVGHTGRMPSSLRPPARRPCESCPYRRDVPAGIWSSEEYAKLRRYDADTPDQPTGLFQCHQADAGSAVRRVCGGWAGCHDSEELLALRLALIDGRMDTLTYKAVVEYVSPMPLFSSEDGTRLRGWRT